MRILPILMILTNPNLQQKTPQHPRPLRIHHPSHQLDILPPPRPFALPLGKLGQVVHAGAREKQHARRGVGLVELEVEVDAQFDDFDQLEEVDGEEVGLGPVGLPELGRGGGAQGVDAAAGFVSADGPGGEGGDFAEVGGVVRVAGCWGGGWKWC